MGNYGRGEPCWDAEPQAPRLTDINIKNLSVYSSHAVEMDLKHVTAISDMTILGITAPLNGKGSPP